RPPKLIAPISCESWRYTPLANWFATRSRIKLSRRDGPDPATTDKNSTGHASPLTWGVRVARVLIVDDHSFIRRGIRSILEGSPEWEVCGEAENGTDAIRLAKELMPDVILMDVSMPGITGFEAARVIRERDSKVKIILVTLHDSPGLIRNAFRLGMNGYLLKAEAERELVRALQD